MRVLTWNLWWRYALWRERQEPIAAVLAEVRPDVCGLQEVWGTPEANQAADLADRLGMHWCWAELPRSDPHPEHGVISIGNAVLSRWPIAEPAEQPLPTAEAEETRVALYTAMDAPGGRLPFFTTHLTFLMIRPAPRSTLFPYTTLFRSSASSSWASARRGSPRR